MIRTSGRGLRIVRHEALTGRELDAWHHLRAGNRTLDSPFFDPGFTAAVQASGYEVDVIVGEDGVGAVRALWPLHLRGRVARPVGWPGADFQGPVLAAEHRLGLPDALDALGIGTLSFDHLLGDVTELAPWVQVRHRSPLLDITGGLPGYLGRASRSGRDNMGQARRRSSKASRELGELRFVADSTDVGLLDRLIELKRGQYAATGARDYFADPRRRDLMHRLLRIRGTSFGGVLSAVYAGPHLLAAHFGMRSGAVLHWWFPVYDPAFGRLAPGWILLRELVGAGPAMGIARIDLGRGDDEYKRRAMTGETTVCEGTICASPLRQAVSLARRRVVAVAKSSSLGPGLRGIVRTARRGQRAIARDTIAGGYFHPRSWS